MAEPATAPATYADSGAAWVAEQPGHERQFWLLTVVTGVAGGVFAAAVVGALQLTQHLAWGSPGPLLDAAASASEGRRIAICGLAGLLVVALRILLQRPLSGHGTSGILEAIWMRGGHYPLRRALLSGAATAVVVGLGAPLGREGAVMAASAGLASALGRRLGLPHERVRLLVACGAAAGISAAYDCPLGGALFGLEVLLGSFALELLGPIVVACVIATVVSRVLVAHHPTFEVKDRVAWPASTVLVAFVVAPCLGVMSAGFVRAISALAGLAERLPPAVRRAAPLATMLAVGGVAVWLPEVLGNGYDPVHRALEGRYALGFLLLLPLVKTLLTGSVSAAGVPGGMFTPSLFVGGMLGGALGAIVERFVPGAPPAGAIALLGMVAILAATTRAAAAAVVILFEMTRDYGAVVPMLATAVIAAAVARRIEPESLYTAVLRRRGVVLPRRPRPEFWRGITVAELVEGGAARVPPSCPFEEIRRQLLALPAGHELCVVDDDRYVGMVTLDGLKAQLGLAGRLDAVVAADVLEHVPALVLTDSLDTAWQALVKTPLERLPVVDADGRLRGTVSKAAVMARAGSGAVARA